MDDGVFDAAAAEAYDDGVARMYAPEVLGPTLDRLELLAGGGRVLEFASGTGRVALGLAERGLDVSGIELSASMTAKLRAKPFGDRVPVEIGDMMSTRLHGEFSLVYLVFNTIGNVTSQDGQVEVFRNAAAHLATGGRFVIELEVPPLQKLPMGERFYAFNVNGGYAGVDEIDVVDQLLTSHHFTVNDDGTGHIFRTPMRYAWPAELDLMARIAGLRPESRWADWTGAPFTADSESHVSVWVRD